MVHNTLHDCNSQWYKCDVITSGLPLLLQETKGALSAQPVNFIMKWVMDSYYS